MLDSGLASAQEIDNQINIENREINQDYPNLVNKDGQTSTLEPNKSIL